MMWLKLEEGETVEVTVMEPVQTVMKHWLEERNRSYLCQGEGCAHCKAGSQPRQRYQVTVIRDGASLRWEFGDEVRTQIASLRFEDGMAKATITRIGSGRKTRYQVFASLGVGSAVDDKYITGKYGHLVRR